MKKLILIVATAFAVSSCKRAGVKTEIVNNIELTLLFEKDGCKMYRFYDGSHWIYWSTCSGSTQYNYNVTTKSGKTTHTSTRKVEAITTPTNCFPLK